MPSGKSQDSLNLLISKDRQLAFLKDLISFAIKMINPKNIILFGSRATGKARRTSDVDLYFDLSGGNAENWTRFCLDAEDHLPTLLAIDFVEANSADAHIKKSIRDEGITIYER